MAPREFISRPCALKVLSSGYAQGKSILRLIVEISPFLRVFINQLAQNPQHFGHAHQGPGEQPHSPTQLR